MDELSVRAVRNSGVRVLQGVAGGDTRTRTRTVTIDSQPLAGVRPMPGTFEFGGQPFVATETRLRRAETGAGMRHASIEVFFRSELVHCHRILRIASTGSLHPGAVRNSAQLPLESRQRGLGVSHVGLEARLRLRT